MLQLQDTLILYSLLRVGPESEEPSGEASAHESQSFPHSLAVYGNALLQHPTRLLNGESHHFQNLYKFAISAANNGFFKHNQL
jgi:hypothetical protein